MAPNGTYSHGQLQACFDSICNKSDWREPIDAVVPHDDKMLVATAISYFTGTPANFTHVPNTDSWRVQADGYRNGPCGP